jgi:surface protein
MFSGCKIFNQPLNNWNVSNVIIMNDIFTGCYNFNQPLNNWYLYKKNNVSYLLHSYLFIPSTIYKIVNYFNIYTFKYLQNKKLKISNNLKLNSALIYIYLHYNEIEINKEDFQKLKNNYTRYQNIIRYKYYLEDLKLYL